MLEKCFLYSSVGMNQQVLQNGKAEVNAYMDKYLKIAFEEGADEDTPNENERKLAFRAYSLADCYNQPPRLGVLTIPDEKKRELPEGLKAFAAQYLLVDTQCPLRDPVRNIEPCCVVPLLLELMEYKATPEEHDDRTQEQNQALIVGLILNQAVREMDGMTLGYHDVFDLAGLALVLELYVRGAISPARSAPMRIVTFLKSFQERVGDTVSMYPGITLRNCVAIFYSCIDSDWENVYLFMHRVFPVVKDLISAMKREADGE